MSTLSLNPVVIVAASILVLFTVACDQRNGTSRGFMLDIATVRDYCGDGLLVVATAIGSHRAKLNFENPAESLGMLDMVAKVRGKFGHRAERLIFVNAEPNVFFSDFVELVDAVRPEVDVISIITPDSDALARKEHLCLVPSCGPCFNLRIAR